MTAIYRDDGRPFSRLRNAMCIANISREEMADKLFMSYGAFSNRLTGKVAFKLDEIWKIIEILKISPYAIPIYFPMGGMERSAA